LPSLGRVGLYAVPLLLYLPFAFDAFERDEGVRHRLAGPAQGDAYRDLFDNKLSAGRLVLALLSYFGESVAAPR
jgi:hypothetical protein